ncbi:S8 family peptidase [Paenibacillus apiarius]|uniref:S8 family peptidase n=1 Tax=Paenibacillus apiarius TaxID=46240 RepID=A0ABT4DT03_9BACL|nr:S8 family peptidase [Paenibacillus apiarius]MCY9517182.1 S8 family peptidase [Paenibacillus apiarius]MCY9519223.1 S8 family peptidase [Paenibacillus apiarius]MCY9555151.1 S8 family peptidase [Paenibacillus apiarius]MCY9559981.1 S8 family peptidase [Paenibacillus apiarius]MCY9683376.1 S8 family peptidase [Paenibacillus apiarius]
MRTLTRMLKAVVHGHPTRKTARKMIILKDRKSYAACVKQLKKQGIVPLKQIESARMLCCHLERHKNLQQIMKHPSIRRIENDARVRAHAINTTQSAKRTKRSSSSSSRLRLKKRSHSAPHTVTPQIPWGIKRIHAPRVWPKTKGKGIKVAIVDTGISTHPDLNIAGGINTIRRGTPYQDDNGHGTHVAGTVAATGTGNMLYGAAPQVELYAVKALDENGDGYVSDIVEGLEWCMKNKMDVINLSLGLSGPSELLRSTVRRAYRKGIVLVASAGNKGGDADMIDDPASYPETIAVTATDKNNQITVFSSRGKGIDVAAPGEDIVSTNNMNGFSKDSGTSMAAPHVTGSVALMLASNSELTPQEVKSALMDTASELKGFSERSQGAGLIRADKATAYVRNQVESPAPLTAAPAVNGSIPKVWTRRMAKSGPPRHKPTKPEAKASSKRRRAKRTRAAAQPAFKLHNVVKPRRR